MECSIVECSKPAKTRGWCNAHYKRWIVHGDPNIDNKTRHGLGDKPWRIAEYRVWAAMKARCNGKTHKQYSYYGGRGITVCERWQNSYLNFLEDMGERPSADHSLDRVNNDGNYEPSNCRWATRSEQNKNRRPFSEEWLAKQRLPRGPRGPYKKKGTSSVS